jgi:DNA polymerase-4
MDVYRAESKKIMALLGQFGGAVEQVSVDEAYLEMTHRFEKFDPPQLLELGSEMKQIIRRERNLTASIGIGSNKLLAKIASDYSKPDGLHCVDENTKATFLRPMPASAIHGVGKVTALVLEKAGLRTIGDLQDYPGDLRSLVGSFGPTLKQYALGEDSRPLELDGAIKSISAEETFDRDTEDRRVLVPSLRDLSEEIATKLGKERMAARTVQVKVRYSDFHTLTRQTSLEEPLESAAEIFSLACAILRREKLVNRPLRLLGVGVSGLVPPSTQLYLNFPE